MTLTASSLDRARKCIASVTLPQAESPSTEGRDRGKAIAAYLDRVPQVGAEQALAEVPQEFAEVCASIELEHLPTTLATEVAWAYNVVTGEALELGRGIDRNYEHHLMDRLMGRRSLDAGEWIFGTVDVLGVSEDAVYVGDHKGFQEVEHAQKNLQVGAGAMAFAKVYDKQKAQVEILRPLKGSPQGTSAWLDAFELEAIEQTLRDIHADMTAARALSGPVSPQPGNHCRYCRAAPNCPVAQTPGHALQLRGKVALDPFGAITRETAADWWMAIAAMDEWLEQKRRVVIAMAAEAPVPLGNGRFLGMTEREGTERIDPVVGYRVLLEHLGEKLANDCAERSITKAAVERGLKANAVPNRTTVAKQIYADIRRMGGAKKSVTKKVGEYGG